MRDDPERLGAVLREARPDVVCIQEAPRFLRWRAKCAQLARSGGLVVVGGGRAAGANVILSALRVDVLATHDVLFSKDQGLHQRGTSIAVLQVEGSPFAVAGTHLDLDEAARLRHVEELHVALADAVPRGYPTIVAGDTNDHPGSAVWTELGRHRRDAWQQALEAGTASGSGDTSTAANPYQRLDAVFLPPGVTLGAARVVTGPDVAAASDHCPLVVDLDVPS